MLTVTITTAFGKTFTQTFAMEEGMRCRIGRDESCEVSVPEESYLSRVHCILSYENGQLLIQDNQSSNGVFLNGERIVSDFLRLGEPYSLGNVTMVVSESDAAEEPSSINTAEAGVDDTTREEDIKDFGEEAAGSALQEKEKINSTETMSAPTPPPNFGTPPEQQFPGYPAPQASAYGQQMVPPGYSGVQGGYGGQPAAPGYPQGYGNVVAPPGYAQGYGAPQSYPNAPVYQQPYSPYAQTGYGVPSQPQGYPMGHPQPPMYPQANYPVNYPQQVNPGAQNYSMNSAYPQAYPVPQAQGYSYPSAAAPQAARYQESAARQQYNPQQYVPESVDEPQEEMMPGDSEEGLEQADVEEEVDEMSVEEQMADELEGREGTSLGKKWVDKARSSLSSGKETLRRWATGLLQRRRTDEEEEIWEEEQPDAEQEEEAETCDTESAAEEEAPESDSPAEDDGAQAEDEEAPIAESRVEEEPAAEPEAAPETDKEEP